MKKNKKPEYIEDASNVVEISNHVKEPKVLSADEKKAKRKKYWIIAIVMAVLSALVFVFGLAWQDSRNLLAIINALFLSGFIFFAFGWFVVMVNMNILSPMTYGFKSFFLIIVGRRPKKGYYEYLQDIKDKPIGKVYYIVPFLTSVPYLVVATILTIVNYNTF